MADSDDSYVRVNVIEDSNQQSIRNYKSNQAAYNTIEKPSYRILIQILLKQSTKDIKILEGSLYDKKTCFSKKFHLLIFLLICCIFCGACVGTLTCTTKLLLDALTFLKTQSLLQIILSPKVLLAAIIIPLVVVGNIWTLN